MNIGLLPLLSEPLVFVVVLVSLALSMAAHEMGHAFAADRLGDPTPRHYGRVTLNPVKHLDPFGLLLLVLVGFGFASTPVNEANLSRWGRMWVAAAGPLVNLVIAILVILMLRFGLIPHNETGLLIARYLISINILLAVINLLPIPMLDGSRILAALVPALAPSLRQFSTQPFAPLLVMGFLYLLSDQISVLRERVAQTLIGVFGG